MCTYKYAPSGIQTWDIWCASTWISWPTQPPQLVCHFCYLSRNFRSFLFSQQWPIKYFQCTREFLAVKGQGFPIFQKNVFIVQALSDHQYLLYRVKIMDPKYIPFLNKTIDLTRGRGFENLLLSSVQGESNSQNRPPPPQWIILNNFVQLQRFQWF